MKSQEIRQKFTEFFEKQGHKKHPSSELVPHDDPSLLFTNAGMNQFKDFFTGKAVAANPRAVSIQKCVRAGGKHNDLENVGFTARHHTFFEMLGNFSFGDYFKRDAIHMAWQLLTEELQIPKERLYITAHYSDQEAEKIWKEEIGIAEDHFFFRGDKDNFWEMGDVGPCGPCSEIFYDHGPAYTDTNLPAGADLLDDEKRYVEIWNLVFMQFEKYRDGERIERRPLPNPSIDTGAGLERLAAVLQAKYNNYDTDVFQGIIAKLESITSKSYEDSAYTTNFRVVADHIRACVMLITDGVIPSNEGRGYVLRRILRRAVRYLNLLGVDRPVLHELVPAVFASLGQEYPQNLQNQEMAIKFLKTEEQSFRQTLSSGLHLLDKEIQELNQRGQKQLSGDVLFKLYDTHGFPVDLTALILQEQGLSVDEEGFAKAMEEQRQRSRKSSHFTAREGQKKDFFTIHEQYGDTEFTGYHSLQEEAKLLAIVEIDSEHSALIFDRSPFYGESGGQIGDTGWIEEVEVLDTQKPVESLIAHIVSASSQWQLQKTYSLRVDQKRRQNIMRNHTATHLLHAALREVLGKHVKQAGSLVAADRLRFDFSHPEKMSRAELERVENLVNNQIFAAKPVQPEILAKEEANQRGAMALFGEKYGEQVRVLTIADFSVELCGGVHVQNTAEIQLFKILSESALSAGVRRIEACSSLEALQFSNTQQQQLAKIAENLKTNAERAPERVEQLQQGLKDKEREIRDLREKLMQWEAKEMMESPQALGSELVYKFIQLNEGADLRKLSDLFLQKHKKSVVMLAAANGDKASVLLRTFKENTRIDCAQLLKPLLQDCGGSGGGKAEMAQGSIPVNQLASFQARLDAALHASI